MTVALEEAIVTRREVQLMRCRLSRWVIVGAGAAVLVACSGPGEEGDGPDAGPPPPLDSGARDGGPADAGPQDADTSPRDAGPAPVDADTGPLDAGPDSGPPPPPATGTYSLGENHTCVIEDAEGRVRCWGYNMGGELGVGSTDSVANGIVPGVAGAVALAAGGYHTCALLADTTVMCWGRNVEGQLGLGHTSAVEPATAVPGTTGASDIDADAHTTCARVSDAVMCWGANGSEQIIAAGADAIVSPTEVSSFRGGTAVAVGNYHICAVVSGAVRCTGTIGASVFEDTVSSLSSGWQHSCAVAGSAAYCWGDGYLGALGDGMTGGGERPLMLVPDVPPTAVAVRTGVYHSCALLAAGDLWCWGNNQGGAIDPAAPHAPGYRPALRASGVTAFDIGGVHTCITDAGGMRCWGNDWAGAVTGVPP